MVTRWIGPDNGDGRVVDFGMSKNEIETRRSEVDQVVNQLGSMSELSVVHVTEVCDSLGIDAYPVLSAVEKLRTACDEAIRQLEGYL